jgi:SAM-dependent methyltransferase
MNLGQVPQGGIRLNLGCGDKLLPGYINVDAASSRKGQKPDVICDIRNLDRFKPGIADEILAVHVIEHFYYWEVIPLLTGWHRVLKPGGLLVLECPNLLSACVEILHNPSRSSMPGPEGQQGMWPLYGDPSWKDPLMCHKWAYTPESLKGILRGVGFVNPVQQPAQFKLREPRDMRISGLKPN